MQGKKALYLEGAKQRVDDQEVNYLKARKGER